MAKYNLEIEICFKISDIKKFRQLLQKIGAQCTEHWQGRDIIFDKRNELSAKGEILRLRLRKQWGEKAKLTYKWPYQDHIFKIREELETWVDEPMIILKLLERIGYEPVIQYEKKTDLWEYKGVELVVEMLPCLGYFMEIEDSEKEIRETAKILGYDVGKGIKKSYCQYFKEVYKSKREWLFNTKIAKK